MPAAPAAPPPAAAPPAAAPAPAPAPRQTAVPGAAPLAKPATPPGPGPSKHPSTQPKGNGARSIADAFTQLDALAGVADPGAKTAEVGSREATQPPTDPNNPPQSAADRNQPPADAPEPAPGDPPVEGARPPEKAATLRARKDQLEVENRTLQSKIQEYEKKLATPPDDTELKQLQAKLSKLEAKNAEYDEELRYSNYEKSEEYAEKYFKPYEKAFKTARAAMADLDVTAEDGTIRPATAADFDAVVALDYRGAKERAKAMFPDDWQTVLNHRKEVLDRNGERAEALETYRKDGKQREAMKSEAMKKGRQEIADHYNTAIKTAVEKYPQWFKSAAGDPVAQEIIDKGMALADAAFNGAMKNEDGTLRKLPPKELAELHAEIRNKAGGFDNVVYRLNKAQSRIKELEKSLKDYEDSEPGGGAGGRRAAAPKTLWDSVDAELRKHAS